jgi:hypothetical protein
LIAEAAAGDLFAGRRNCGLRRRGLPARNLVMPLPHPFAALVNYLNGMIQRYCC